MAHNFHGTGWGNDQFQFGVPSPVQFQPQPFWSGVDFFRAHAATVDPVLYDQVYSILSGANGPLASLGVGLNEARIWHERAYGGLGLINTLSPREIGYAAAYEVFRLWIHNSGLYEPLGGEMERQREALIGLAIAEVTNLYSRPTAPYGQITACEAAAATASLIFQENLAFGGRGYGMTGYPGTGTYPGSPGVVGYYPPPVGMGVGAVGPYGSLGTFDPYAIDRNAPYFRRYTGFGQQRRSSSPGPGMLSPGYSGGIHNRSPVPPSPHGRPGSAVGSMHGIGGSPHVGSQEARMYPPASPFAPVSNTPVPRVTTVATMPGQTTIIELPKRHRSSGRHHHRHGHHHQKRSKSTDPIMTPFTGGGFGNAASGAARAVGSVAGGIVGGAAGLVGGAVGGLARGATGGASGAMGVPGSRMGPSLGYAGIPGTTYPAAAPGYGYGSIYRWY